MCGTGKFLDIYAAGSDYEMQLYSRVFFHHATPTHEVFCKAGPETTVVDVLSEREIQPETCIFDRLVSRKDAWYDDEPPFDHVLLEAGDVHYLCPVASVKFDMRRMRNSG